LGKGPWPTFRFSRHGEEIPTIQTGMLVDRVQSFIAFHLLGVNNQNEIDFWIVLQKSENDSTSQIQHAEDELACLGILPKAISDFL
jgi:hypothetical protein